MNGDGRPDLFVAGYTDINAPIPASTAGFPTNHVGVRDRLYLNEGPDANGRSRFREVGKRAGLEASAPRPRPRSGLHRRQRGRPARPLRRERPRPEPALPQRRPTAAIAGSDSASRSEHASEGIDDPNAGMGIAAADYSLDGRDDLFVTNSRRQLHAVYRSAPQGARSRSPTPGPTSSRRSATSYTGWGVSWVDLDLDGNLDLVLANGAIPVVNLKKDAQRIQVLENLTGEGRAASSPTPAQPSACPPASACNGRGLAAADYDNDGDLDVAINSIGGPLLLLRNSGAAGHWLEVKLSGFAPGTRVTAVLPERPASSCARFTPAAATSPRRIPASTSASETRRRSPSWSCASPTAASHGYAASPPTSSSSSRRARR